MTFFWCKVGFEKCIGASPQSNHWAGHNWLSYKIHFSSHITTQSRNGSSLLLHRIREDDISKWFFFFICSQLMRHPFSELFHLSSLLHMLNDHRMDNADFLSTFSCNCKRITFSDPLNQSLSPSNNQLLCSSTLRLSSPLQNFLNYSCTVLSLAVSGSNALLMWEVVSTALQPILKLE